MKQESCSELAARQGLSGSVLNTKCTSGRFPKNFTQWTSNTNRPRTSDSNPIKLLSECSESIQSHTSGAVFREPNTESGRVEDWRVVVLVQNGHCERNATVQTSDVLRHQIELNARLLEGLTVQCSPLAHAYHTLMDGE